MPQNAWQRTSARLSQAMQLGIENRQILSPSRKLENQMKSRKNGKLTLPPQARRTTELLLTRSQWGDLQRRLKYKQRGQKRPSKKRCSQARLTRT